MPSATPDVLASAARLPDAELRRLLQVYLEGGKPGFTLPVLLNEVLTRWRVVGHH